MYSYMYMPFPKVSYKVGWFEKLPSIITLFPNWLTSIVEGGASVFEGNRMIVNGCCVYHTFTRCEKKPLDHLQRQVSAV